MAEIVLRPSKRGMRISSKTTSGCMLGEADHRLQAVGGRIDFEAAHAQAAGQQLALVVVVFDDERR